MVFKKKEFGKEEENAKEEAVEKKGKEKLESYRDRVSPG